MYYVVLLKELNLLEIKKLTFLLLIGRFPRFGDFHISGLRPKDLECNFGLSCFSENGKM